MAAMGPQVPGIIGAYYGRDVLLSLIALIISVSMFGMALGPLLGGIFYDIAGGYSVAFLVAAVLYTMGCLLYLLLKPPPASSKSTT